MWPDKACDTLVPLSLERIERPRRETVLDPMEGRFTERLADERDESPLNRWQFPVAVASLVLGIAISLQFRATNEAKLPNSNFAQRSDLVAELKLVKDERDRLQSELTEVRAQMAKSTGGGESLRKELDAARVQAGLTSLKGPGVVVRLSDSPRTPGSEDVAYDYIVHDIDLSVLVNELWASGAEAVVVNDQRIVGRSSIRCVGPTVLVNTNRVASPFIVKAIGDVDNLEGGLKMPGGFLDSMNRLTNNGGEVVISRMREVQVPAYQGALIYQYAVPGEEETQSAKGAEVGVAP